MPLDLLPAINKYNEFNNYLADKIVFEIVPYFRSSTAPHKFVWQAYQTAKINVAVELQALWEQNGNIEPYPHKEPKYRTEHKSKFMVMTTRQLDAVAADIVKVLTMLEGLILDLGLLVGNKHRVVIALNRVKLLLEALQRTMQKEIEKLA